MSPRLRVLVTGSHGLLGATLVPAWLASGLDVVTHTRAAEADVVGDLCTPAGAEACVAAAPDVILHLAAWTDVDGCEADPVRAYRANAQAVGRLADAIAASPCPPHLVCVSTDQVYNGPGPHAEDEVAPINVYAWSKLLGEAYASRVGATVIRTNFVGPSSVAARVSLTDWLVRAARAGQAITVYEDVRFSPLSMATLITCLEAVVRAPVAGIYNLGAREGMSKAHFAFALLAAAGVPTTTVTRGRSTTRAHVARRPADMTLDCARFVETFGLTLPSVHDEVHRLGELYASVRP